MPSKSSASASSPICESAVQNYKNLIQCAFHMWYEKFEKITIPSKYFKIPDIVLEYLRDETIILPEDCVVDHYEGKKQCSTNYFNDDIDEYDDVENKFGHIFKSSEFIEFTNKIRSAIKELNGYVFIKTNWHSPKDAFWIILGQTLKVGDIKSVYQLFKASCIVREDINPLSIQYPLYQELDHYLVLKKWQEINSGTEYRCFVKNRSIIAVSPRDWPQYHEHILTQKHDIVQDIVTMFKEQIKYQFTLDNFIFDVIRTAKDKVYLIDFSPFGSLYADSLAFTWEELEQTIQDEPEFRYLSSDCGIQPSKRNNYGIPQDIIDLFTEESSSFFKL